MNGGAPRPAQRFVNLDEDQQPVMKVLVDACRQSDARLEWEHYDNDPWFLGIGSTLAPYTDARDVAKPSFAPMAIAGPAVMFAGQIDNNIDLTRPAQQDYCAISITAFWEPRFTMLYRASKALATSAVDENGTSLAPAPGTPLDDPNATATTFNFTGLSNATFPGPSQFNAPDFQLRLNVPPNAGHRIAKASGLLSVWVAGKYDDLDLTDLLKQPFTQVTFHLSDGMTVIGSMTGDRGLMLQINRQNASAGLWETERAVIKCVKVAGQQADGTRFSEGLGGSSWGPDFCQQYFNNFPQGSLTGVTVKYPVQVRQVDLPFTFTDLPLR